MPFGPFNKGDRFHGRTRAGPRHFFGRPRLLVLAVIVGIGSTYLQRVHRRLFAGEPTINDAMSVVLGALCAASPSASSDPGIANGIVSGGPQLGRRGRLSAPRNCTVRRVCQSAGSRPEPRRWPLAPGWRGLFACGPSAVVGQRNARHAYHLLGCRVLPQHSVGASPGRWRVAAILGKTGCRRPQFQPTPTRDLGPAPVRSPARPILPQPADAWRGAALPASRPMTARPDWARG